MAGSISIEQYPFGRKRTIVLKCTSDASGDVNGVPIQLQGGDIYALAYVPETGCSNGWDLTLPAKHTTRSGDTVSFADALDGNGADLSNSTDGGWVNLPTPFQFTPGMQITPTIENLGDAQVVWIFIHIWEEIRV